MGRSLSQKKNRKEEKIVKFHELWFALVYLNISVLWNRSMDWRSLRRKFLMDVLPRNLCWVQTLPIYTRCIVLPFTIIANNYKMMDKKGNRKIWKNLNKNLNKYKHKNKHEYHYNKKFNALKKAKNASGKCKKLLGDRNNATFCSDIWYLGIVKLHKKKK